MVLLNIGIIEVETETLIKNTVEVFNVSMSHDLINVTLFVGDNYKSLFFKTPLKRMYIRIESDNTNKALKEQDAHDFLVECGAQPFN